MIKTAVLALVCLAGALALVTFVVTSAPHVRVLASLLFAAVVFAWFLVDRRVQSEVKFQEALDQSWRGHFLEARFNWPLVVSLSVVVWPMSAFVAYGVIFYEAAWHLRLFLAAFSAGLVGVGLSFNVPVFAGLFKGYACRLDSEGLHVPGVLKMPWSCVASIRVEEVLGTDWRSYQLVVRHASVAGFFRRIKGKRTLNLLASGVDSTGTEARISAFTWRLRGSLFTKAVAEFHAEYGPSRPSRLGAACSLPTVSEAEAGPSEQGKVASSLETVTPTCAQLGLQQLVDKARLEAIALVASGAKAGDPALRAAWHRYDQLRAQAVRPEAPKGT